jgi:hypothetical protein
MRSSTCDVVGVNVIESPAMSSTAGPRATSVVVRSAYWASMLCPDTSNAPVIGSRGSGPAKPV